MKADQVRVKTNHQLCCLLAEPEHCPAAAIWNEWLAEDSDRLNFVHIIRENWQSLSDICSILQ